MTEKKPLWVRDNYRGTPYQMFFRKAASLITERLQHTHVTPNQVTFTATLLYIIPAMLLYQRNVWLNVLAVLSLYFITVLDKVDGQLARVKKMPSKRGLFLDGMLHNVGIIAVYIALGIRMLQEGNTLAYHAAVASVITLLFMNFNHINRAYIVGSDPDNNLNKLQLDKQITGKKILTTLFSLPGQNFPEILLIALVANLIPWLLFAYLAYNLLQFFTYAFVFSKFAGE